MKFVEKLEEAIKKASKEETTPEEIASSPMMLLGTVLMAFTGVGLFLYWIGRSLWDVFRYENRKDGK
jgi:hypothetical protein